MLEISAKLYSPPHSNKKYPIRIKPLELADNADKKIRNLRPKMASTLHNGFGQHPKNGLRRSITVSDSTPKMGLGPYM